MARCSFLSGVFVFVFLGGGFQGQKADVEMSGIELCDGKFTKNQFKKLKSKQYILKLRAYAFGNLLDSGNKISVS